MRPCGLQGLAWLSLFQLHLEGLETHSKIDDEIWARGGLKRISTPKICVNPMSSPFNENKKRDFEFEMNVPALTGCCCWRDIVILAGSTIHSTPTVPIFSLSSRQVQCGLASGNDLWFNGRYTGQWSKSAQIWSYLLILESVYGANGGARTCETSLETPFKNRPTAISKQKSLSFLAVTLARFQDKEIQFSLTSAKRTNTPSISFTTCICMAS